MRVFKKNTFFYEAHQHRFNQLIRAFRGYKVAYYNRGYFFSA